MHHRRVERKPIRVVIAEDSAPIREGLAAMAEGRTNTGIETALGITEGATEKHISSIFGKLELPETETETAHRPVLAVPAYLGS